MSIELHSENEAYLQKLKQGISLIVSEAIIKEIDKEDFMTLCQHMSRVSKCKDNGFMESFQWKLIFQW